MSTSLRRLVGTVAVVIAIFFSLAAAAQYWFVSHKLHEATKQELWNSAEEIREVIAYQGAWDLTGYRRTGDIGGVFVLQSASGTLIDTISFIRGTVSRVSLPFAFEPDQPFRAKSEVGEEWLLDVHPLQDGMVVLGVRTDVLPENAQQRMLDCASRFGHTLQQALRIKERSIDESLDFAILDSRGTLLSADSGIPLKAEPPEIPQKADFVPIRSIGGGLYAVLNDPVVDAKGAPVGLITTFEDVTDQEEVLHRTATFNAAVAIAVWLISVAIIGLYLKRIRGNQISCGQVLLSDESDRIEFKSSLRWDYDNKRANKEMELQVLKAAVGFLNSETGGTLAIGVSDQKEVLGLEADYATFRGRRNRDGFEQALRQVLINALGERRCARFTKVSFCSLEGKDICLVNVSPAREAVFLEEPGGKMTTYLRVGNATRPLNIKEAVSYASERWGSPSLQWPLRRPKVHPSLGA